MWTDREAVEAARDVESLVDHPGYEHLLDAVVLRVEALHAELIDKKPSSSAAEYADIVGQLRGLRELHGLAEGVIRYGRKAEEALRQEEMSYG